jgi:hypothetical protein
MMIGTFYKVYGGSFATASGYQISDLGLGGEKNNGR